MERSGLCYISFSLLSATIICHFLQLQSMSFRPSLSPLAAAFACGVESTFSKVTEMITQVQNPRGSSSLWQAEVSLWLVQR